MTPAAGRATRWRSAAVGAQGGTDAWLLAILAISGALNAYHLHWGLPNGNDSWAQDALGPLTVLGIIKRSFGTWNSGWFWFKYPPGYPLLLAATFAPYLAFLHLTGGWVQPAVKYPYGFGDPERALFVMALLGRALNVLFALGTVVLAYAIGRRLFDRIAGRLSAILVATAYPIVYYAHTTNLDSSYTFWLVLALYCALVASENDRPLPWVGMGAAAAMAVSTKEQGFAFLLPLPFLALAARIRARRTPRACWAPSVWAMVATAVATALVANNVLFNPLGFVGRLAFLLGRPLQPVAARLAPVEFAVWKGAKEWTYLTQLWDALDSSLGTPLACLAAVGSIGAWRWPRAACWLVLPVLSHYYLSLRGLDLITLRYVLPITVVAAVVAAGVLIKLRIAVRSALARRTIGAACAMLIALGMARSIELDWLLRTDSRYQAEAWMAAHVAAGSRGEVYQKPAYVPRFDRRWSVERVPVRERAIDGFNERRPEFVVLSSASRQSITHVWNPDWRTTRQLLTPVHAAQRFLDALEGGQLGYVVAARTRQSPHLLRLRITSLAPEITIYVRDQH